MKKIIFYLLLLSLPAYSQQTQLIDSLTIISSSSSHDTIRIKALLDLSWEHLNIDPTQSVMYCNQAIELSKKIRNKKFEANSWNELGIVEISTGNYNDAIDHINMALEIRRSRNDKEGIGGCLVNLSMVYDRIADYEMAIESLIEAIKYLEQTNNKRFLANSYINLAGSYSSIGRPDKKKEYLLKAEAIDKELGDQYGRGVILSGLGEVYYTEKDYATAIEYYKNAEKCYQEIDNVRGLGSVYGNISEIYLEQNKFAEAINYAEKSLKYYQQGKLFLEEGNTYIRIARIKQKQNKLQEALEFALTGYALIREKGSFESWLEAFNALSNIYTEKGDFKNAYKFKQLQFETSDSIFNIQTLNQATNLEAKYQNQKHLREIEKKKFQLQQKNILNYALLGGVFLLAILGVIAFLSYRRKKRDHIIITEEKKRSEELLLNILPKETAEELKAYGKSKARSYDQVTVLFTDFKDFTKISEKLSPEELVNEINECFSEFDKIIVKHKLEKIKTIGDAYMAAGGLPVPNTTHVEDTIKAAMDIQKFMEIYKKKKAGAGFEIRIGIHTGPVVAGIVGIKKFAYDIWGDTVNTAARIEQNSEAGKINISCTTYGLIKDKFKCIARGKIETKNKGELEMYFVEEVY